MVIIRRAESRGMDVSYLEISGGKPLCGEICVQGSKNAVLPILAACMPGEGVCVIENCPSIGDVEDTAAILRSLGCVVSRDGDRISINASGAGCCEIKRAEAVRIRSSVLFLGALLGKMGRAVLPLPGGCAIGRRPVDFHLRALEQLGAVFSVGETIAAKAERLRGSTIRLEMPSVGATENIILAAVMADGETVIENAAKEPEIDELCTFLKLRGAAVEREEDGSIRIAGGRPLGAAVYRMRADRIVTGTYLLAAAATGGRIRIRNDSGESLDSLMPLLQKLGVRCSRRNGMLEADASGRKRAVPYIETSPYPGFPTDLQSPLMAVLCTAKGKSCICEKIFENRFRTAHELCKMGAQITVNGNCAEITGVPFLDGTVVEAPDLRGGAGLVIAALCARGRTLIGSTGYIERGYEDICRDLRAFGADIRRIDEDGRIIYK